jgi:hypothetical protein
VLNPYIDEILNLDTRWKWVVILSHYTPEDRAPDNCQIRGWMCSRTCLGTMEKGRKNLLPLMGIEA